MNSHDTGAGTQEQRRDRGKVAGTLRVPATLKQVHNPVLTVWIVDKFFQPRGQLDRQAGAPGLVHEFDVDHVK